MRILIHDYAGHAFPIELSRELAQRGHQVLHAFAANLLTPRGALTRRSEDPPGLEFREVPMNANYRRDKYSFVRRRSYEVAYGSTLVDLIKTWKPEVVLSGQTPTEPQRKAQKYCRRSGVRFLNWIQDIYSVAVSKLAQEKLPLVGNAVGSYYRHLDRICAWEAEHNIVITDDFTPILREWRVDAKRITTIENWAAIDALPVRPKDNPWARRHGLHDQFVFLYSGTLAMKHNPELLLQLAVEFRTDPTVAVVVVSEGPGSDWLADRIKAFRLSNLKLLPFQAFDELPDLLGSADVLLAVLESDAGAFSVPSKVLSYFCAGRPLLTAMPANNRAARLVNSIPAGVVVAPEATGSFVANAVQLRHNTALRNAYGNAARLYAEKHFETRKITDCFENILTPTRDY